MKRELSILRNYILYILIGITIALIGISNVFAVSVTDYATRYYYGEANSSTTNYTDYRTGSNNKVTLLAPTAPTYANAETFNGFYNRVNYSITNGSIYTLSLSVSFSNLASGEWGENNINNRLLSTDFAHCSACTITAVSGSIRRYNSTNPSVSGLYDYVVQMNYTFVATSSTNQFYIGSYTGDDRTMGVNDHLYTSVIMVYSLDISNDNSSTIINQNETIINQNQQMIDENAQNTQDIINNQNQNTQDIIDTQNQNTQDIIDSNLICTHYDKSSITTNYKSIQNSNGELSTNNTSGVTDFIKIDSNSIIKLTHKNASYQANMCFYNINKSYISCFKQQDLTEGQSVTIPSGADYVRFTIFYDSNSPQWDICRNGNQALNDSLNDDDTTGATSEASDFFSDFNTNTFGLTSIITAPLNLIQSLTSSTCSQLELPLPYLNNKKLILPCMTDIYSQYFGTFFTMYQTITFGIIAYWVCVRIFNLVKDFKNPEHDEIEVVDL